MDSAYAPLDGADGSWEQEGRGGGGGSGSFGDYSAGSLGAPGGGGGGYYAAYDGLDDETGAMAVGGGDDLYFDGTEEDDHQLDVYGTTPMRDL